MAESKTTIGLVLARMPRYSETFLANKIKGLTNSGFNVILFTDKPSESKHGFREVVGYTLPTKPVRRFIVVMAVMILTAICSPRRFYRFFKLEHSGRFDFVLFAKKVFTSAHILPYSIDYLHFCFTTLGVNRENVGKAMDAKVSTSFRGYDIDRYPLTRLGVYSRLWRRLDKVHTISDSLYQKARFLGLPESVPCEKIMPAIDASRFLHEKKHRGVTDFVKILTVARLQWVKGLEVAIDAMAILKSKGVNFRYTIVGDGEERERLLFARHQHGLMQEVIFAGQKDHTVVAEMMKEHDLYIQPSLQEGFCNAVLEAQASGLFCIVSDAGGLPENVLDKKTGWVVLRGCATALADMISKVSTMSNNEKENISRAAIERVKRDFTIDKQQSHFARFFRY